MIGTEAQDAPDWRPFIESLYEAAGLFDTGLAWHAQSREVEPDGAPPARVVPMTAGDAEELMAAVSFLARRLTTAAESAVFCTAEARLASEDPAPQVDALALTALHAQALRQAAELADAAAEATRPSVPFLAA
jgi:hypothetical protein